MRSQLCEVTVKSRRGEVVRAIFVAAVLMAIAWILFRWEDRPALTRRSQDRPTQLTQPGLAKDSKKLPLRFEANLGQSDPQVRFLARGNGYTLFLTQESAVLVLRRGELHQTDQASNPRAELAQFRSAPLQASSFVGSSISDGSRNNTRSNNDAIVSMAVVGMNPHSKISGVGELPGKSNYFIGNNPAKWRTNIPNYAEVKFQSVYPGVDLVYYGNQGKLEYDFVVQPGGDPHQILLDVGAVSTPSTNSHRSGKLRLAENGDLLVNTDSGEVVFQKPAVYQPGTDYEPGTADRELIEGKYVLIGAHKVGFQIAAYDHRKPLVIDPTLIYSTYLGGNFWDKVNAITADSAGHAYVTGKTASTNFPTTPGVFRKTLNGRSTDVFITELNSAGSGLVYSTYLGGSNEDEGFGIALDASGNAYVTGWTASSDFPTTAGVVQGSFGGGYSDAFVTKLNATGSALLYSTYLGGKSYDEGRGIALDAAGDVYIAGLSYSTNFPIVAGAFQSTLHGYDDAFISKLNPTGTALIYSTYLGSNSYDQAYAIAVDASGNAYVAGSTYSSFFPTTRGALQTAQRGGFDGFVSKLNATGSTLLYSTYLGGSGDDYAYGLALDASGNAYVTGRSYSSDFPTTAGVFQSALSAAGTGVADAFVAKLNPTGAALVYSTYVGGANADAAYSIAVDSLGDAFITGDTNSPDFPTTPGAFQPTIGGLDDAFMAKLNPLGTALLYSTYMGGTNIEGGSGIVVDASGVAYVGGWTNSTNFPTSAGSFQTTLPGTQNGFVFVINPQ